MSDYQKYEEGVKNVIQEVIDSKGKSKKSASTQILTLSSSYYSQKHAKKKQKYKTKYGLMKDLQPKVSLCQKTCGSCGDWVRWFIKWLVTSCAVTFIGICVGAVLFWTCKLLLFIYPYVNFFPVSQ